MSEHTVTDALTLLTRLAEPGAVVAVTMRAGVMNLQRVWWVFEPDGRWPKDPKFTLDRYEVEVYPSMSAARAAHPDARHD